MWTWLKEFLFGKKSFDEPVLVQNLAGKAKDTLEEEVNRKELSFLEEIKIIFGEHSQLFTSRYDEKFNFISTDYVDDEGLKELSIIGFHNDTDQVLVIFKGVMQDGTFDVGKVSDISETFNQRMDYMQLEYNEIKNTLDVVVSLSRDLAVDDERQRELVMNILYKIAANITQVMPDIRRQYSQSKNAQSH